MSLNNSLGNARHQTLHAPCREDVKRITVARPVACWPSDFELIEAHEDVCRIASVLAGSSSGEKHLC